MTRRLRSASLAAWLVGCWLTLSAPATARTLNFEYLGARDNLDQETVTQIVQDRSGYMWFGGQQGLGRFDGYRVKVFKTEPKDRNSLLEDAVQALLVDNAGKLWIGTRSGLQRHDAASDRFDTILGGRSEPEGTRIQVTAMTPDGAGGIWVATNHGLLRIDQRSGAQLAALHADGSAGGLSSDGVLALARDTNGDLWIGTSSGLDLLPAGASQVVHQCVQRCSTDQRPHETIQKLLLDRHRRLWIATLDQLYLHLPDSTDMPRRFGIADGLLPGATTAIAEDNAGLVWLGTNSHGLQRWDDGLRRFVHYADDARVTAAGEVAAIYQDRGGVLWVGTWTAGVKHVDLDSGGFDRYVHSPGDPTSLSDNRVYGITGDGAGNLLLATFGGIDRFNLASDQVVPTGQAGRRTANMFKEDEIVLTLHRDAAGVVWVGTSDGFGTFDLQTGRFTRIAMHEGSGNSDSTTHVTSDHSGTVWISTRGGLYAYDPKTASQHYYHHDPADPDSLSDDWVKMTAEDRDGTIWVGTDNGLDALDRSTGKFRHFHNQAGKVFSLSSDRIQCLFVDRNGELWIGTNGGGLNHMVRMEPGVLQFRSYTVEDGLGSNSIGAILEDQDANLWLSTASGLSRFARGSQEFRNFTARDGMIEGYYFTGASFRDVNGTMYFGGANGLTAFDPASIRSNPHAPPVVITDVRVQGKPAVRGAAGQFNEVTLNWDESNLAIEFAALSFAAPQANQFRYRLQGFDKEWVVSDASKRSATYTNLEPGHYRFTVCAANKDGVWNDNGATLDVVVVPPVWKALWFRSLVIVALILIVYLFEKFRTRLHEEQKTRLEMLVSARTSEVQQQKQTIEASRNELEVAHRNLSTLSQIGQSITSKLDRPEIARMVSEHVARLMQVDSFCLWLRPGESLPKGYCVTLASDTPPQTPVSIDHAMLANWCDDAQRVQIVDDARSDPRLCFIPQCGAIRPGSILAAPVSVNQRVVGLISVQCVVENAFHRTDLETLTNLATYAGIAMDNAAAYGQLQAAQGQLQNYLSDKERLFMSISHDLRSPITRLILRTELLDDETLREEFYEDLDDLDMLVKGALQSARDTDIHENLTEIELDVLVRRLLRGARLAGHDIAFQDTGFTVFAKPLALKRAIGNLLDNALKYGKRAAIAVGGDEAHVDISVRDFGPGVKDSELAALTGSYVRLDYGREQNTGGIGLGLNIVKGIVEAHRGELTLQNHPEGGLVATIRLSRTLDMSLRRI